MISRLYRPLTIALVLALLPAGLMGCSRPRISDSQRINWNRAATCVRQGLQAESIEKERAYYIEACEYDPLNVWARNNLGVCYFKENRYYEAAREFGLAIKAAPRAPEPHFNMGLLYETVGRVDQSCDQYSRACQLAPATAKYKVSLARAYVKKGENPWKARELLEDALQHELDPETISWIKKTQSLLRQNRFDLTPLH